MEENSIKRIVESFLSLFCMKQQLVDTLREKLTRSETAFREATTINIHAQESEQVNFNFFLSQVYM